MNVSCPRCNQSLGEREVMYAFAPDLLWHDSQGCIGVNCFGLARCVQIEVCDLYPPPLRGESV